MCTNALKCIFCAENHHGKDCKKQHKCANCSYANEKFGEKYSTNHMASDAKVCEILKKQIAVCIASTDYPVRPLTPNYIGSRSPSSMSNFNDNNEIQHQSLAVDNVAPGNQSQVLTPKEPQLLLPPLELSLLLLIRGDRHQNKTLHSVLIDNGAEYSICRKYTKRNN